MSAIKVERPRHLNYNNKRVSFENRNSGPNSPTLIPSPKKIKLDPEIRTRRKRTHSCSFLLEKKRRKTIVLPTKFLLGGNITDPLNLEALSDDDYDQYFRKELEPVYRGETVKVIIPPNINDPLNLDACSEDGEEQLADAISRQRRRRKFRKRKRRNSEPTSGAMPTPTDTNMSASLDEDLCKMGSEVPPMLKDTSVDATPSRIVRQISCPSVVDKKKSMQPSFTSNHNKRWRPKADRIVSPVIKQPGVKQWHYQPDKPPQEKNQKPDKSQDISSPKSYNPKNVLYQYGNYHQYYGYRNPGHAIDPRLKYFQRFWFEGKDVLDIGCNIGHIAFLVARDFRARSVIGIDIDRKLIAIANKNVRHYESSEPTEQEAQFPKSMRIMYGRLKPIANEEDSQFPHNVRFYQNNYVMETTELLETIREEFDSILCLSVTKWVHLNFGDDGLKRFFQRIYRNLRPNGLLVLEPQGWPSYKKKRKLTPKIFETYKSIKFYPTDFEEFLTKTLGFFHVHTFRVEHFSKGFHRQLCIFRKPTEVERRFRTIAKTVDKGSQTEEITLPTPPPSVSPTNTGIELSGDKSNVATAGPSGNSSPQSANNKSSLLGSPKTVARRTEAEGLQASVIINPTGEKLKRVKKGVATKKQKKTCRPKSTIDRPLEGNKTPATEACINLPTVIKETDAADDSNNSPTVGSTTDNFPSLPISPSEVSTCDSTTHSRPASPTADIPSPDKS